MPLYECHCMGCDLTFEVLAPLREARRKKPCPSCGRPAPRVTSPFAIARAEGGKAAAEPAPAKKKNERPPCLQYPHLPLLCHMDEKSAKRAIAYAQKRGAQYDDTLANREYLAKKRGVPPKPEPPAAPAHGHTHDFKRHAPKTAKHDHHDHQHDDHHHAHKGGHAHSHDAGHSH